MVAVGSYSVGLTVSLRFHIDVSADLVAQALAAGQSPPERCDESLIALATFGLCSRQAGFRQRGCAGPAPSAPACRVRPVKIDRRAQAPAAQKNIFFPVTG
jgi:hypothetical protein